MNIKKLNEQIEEVLKTNINKINEDELNSKSEDKETHLTKAIYHLLAVINPNNNIEFTNYSKNSMWIDDSSNDDAYQIGPINGEINVVKTPDYEVDDVYGNAILNVDKLIKTFEDIYLTAKETANNKAKEAVRAYINEDPNFDPDSYSDQFIEYSNIV